MKKLLVPFCLTLIIFIGSVGVSESADMQKGNAAYDRGDYATALKEFTPLAKQGNATAQFNLGVMYANGQGVPKNYKTAVKWWKLAAKQGFALAQGALDGIARLEAEEAKQQAEEAKREAYKKAAAEKAAEDAKEENWLKNVYYSYMNIKGCYEIREPYAVRYLNTQQMADAKVHIKNLESWATKKLNLKSDVEWGRANTQFQKEMGKTFRTLKAMPDYNKQMDASCKIQLNQFMGIEIPGKKKTMKKDF